MVEIHKYSVKQRRDQLATTRSIHTSRGETLHLLPAAGRGAVSLIFVNFGRENTAVAKIPGRRGTARATHAQFYHVTVRSMTTNFVQRCQSILRVQSMV